MQGVIRDLDEDSSQNTAAPQRLLDAAIIIVAVDVAAERTQPGQLDDASDAFICRVSRNISRRQIHCK